MPDRIILHIDMDAFFASVEQRDNASLRDCPIAVIGAGKRTVLVSPSYEAREYGVKTGMRKDEAKSLCANISFVQADAKKYADECSRIMHILYNFTPDLEVYSIDEFFLDISDTVHLFGTPLMVAEKIRCDIKHGLGLNASVGISYNKLLAKLASDKAKPNGIYSIQRSNAQDLLDQLAPVVMWGIGSKTAKELEAMGISTLKHLRLYDISMLTRKFGILGKRLHLIACGVDESEVMPFGSEEDVKSIGHSMTFEKDASDPATLKRYLLELSDMVGRRLRREALSAKCIKLTIRYKSFKTFSKQRALETATDDTKTIYITAISILTNIALKEPIRLLGVTASRVVPSHNSGHLFEDARRKYKLNALVDNINRRFGDSSVLFASLLATKKDKHKQVISPAWRPYGQRNY